MDTQNTPYFASLRRQIANQGGLCNAHLHLDRSGTHDLTIKLLGGDIGSSISHLSLQKKHAIVPLIHASSAYDRDQLAKRSGAFLDAMMALGTTRADTFVDVTDDEVGLSALEVFLELKDHKAPGLDLRVGAYSPLGFRDDEPRRWRLLEHAAARADFIGSLPERDEHEHYPGHIGFDENLRRVCELGDRLGKEVHIHVDQENRAIENGSERVLHIAREMGLGTTQDEPPRTWLIHVISPSAYPEERFTALLADMADLNIGVITCPSAALSMRQVRPETGPTRNSIARILEMLAAGIHVRVGSDNIFDITSPAGTLDLVDELFVLSNAIRFYDIDILAHLGAGLKLSPDQRERIRLHLAHDQQAISNLLPPTS